MIDNQQDEKMLQVRLAYRYLFDFHDRLRSTINTFVGQFAGFEFCHADTIYHGRPSFRTNPHDKWLIDYFPLMNYTMMFKHSKLSQILTVQTFCDSGVSDFFDEGGKTDLKIRDLKSEAKTSTSDIYVGLLEVTNVKNLSAETLIEFWYKQGHPSDELRQPLTAEFNSSYEGYYVETSFAIGSLTNKSTISKKAKDVQETFSLL